jgi:hypothetical protein
LNPAAFSLAMRRPTPRTPALRGQEQPGRPSRGVLRWANRERPDEPPCSRASCCGDGWSATCASAAHGRRGSECGESLARSPTTDAAVGVSPDGSQPGSCSAEAATLVLKAGQHRQSSASVRSRCLSSTSRVSQHTISREGTRGNWNCQMVQGRQGLRFHHAR